MILRFYNYGVASNNPFDITLNGRILEYQISTKSFKYLWGGVE